MVKKNAGKSGFVYKYKKNVPIGTDVNSYCVKKYLDRDLNS